MFNATQSGSLNCDTVGEFNAGNTLIYVGSEGGAGGPGGPGGFGGRAGGGPPSIYTVQDNGKRMTRIATGTPRPATMARATGLV